MDVFRQNKIMVLLVLVEFILVGCNEFRGKSKSAELISGIDLSGMDTSVRPQDDFHNFVNGLWLKNTPIPAQYGSYGAFVLLREESEKNLRRIIDESAAKTDAAHGSVEKKVGDFYAGFMDEATIEARGLEGIEPLLAKIATLSNRQELMQLFSQFVRMGLSVPFDGGVIQDFKEPEKYAYYIGQSGLGLPNRDYYLEKDNKRFQVIVNAYPDCIVSLFTLAGIENPAEKAAAIVALETRLAQSNWSSIENRNTEKIYNPMTLEQLNQNSSMLQWKSLLVGLGIKDQAFIVVMQPSYFSALGKLIDSESLETWKSYLSLRLISGLSNYLPKVFADAHFDFYGRKVDGLEKQKERWRRGVATVDGSLGEALGRIYVERHFPSEAKVRMQLLVENLLNEFAIGIDNLHWMSEKTKIEAKNKLSRFTVKIGYPNKWRDYAALSIDRDDLVGNVRRTRIFEYNYNINKLGGPIDRGEWGMTPQTVNAYYSPTKNEIVFPAAILQPPFFNLNADDAVNYGAIGLVIGHEISHGFDDQGSKFDGDGGLRNWWSDEDRQRFESSTSKLVAQYDAFSPIKDMNIKGQLTLGENIGDLSGATVALKAYQRSLKGKPAPVMDGFTGLQRFFIGFGQAWRTKYRDEVLVKRLVSDPHSPPRYRVNGVVPNMPEFYKAFAVKEGDGHYLPTQQRVDIW